jgi:2-dehydro-3-deoxyglucarate aldolase
MIVLGREGHNPPTQPIASPRPTHHTSEMLGTFRKRLWARESLIGTFVTLPEPAVAEILADLGFDWLFVDGEHGPLETREILGILQAVGDRVPCLVRVPCSEEPPIKMALDLGAEGVIVPQVNTAEQAASVVQFARYAPAGSRGVGLARAHGYGMHFQEYLEAANDRVAVIVQAEHARAVENIESIVKVEGIDAVLVGRYDLAASLGKMGRIDDPAVTDAVDHVTRTCQAAGVPLGCFGVSAQAIRPYMERGYTMIAAGVDTLFLAGAARHLLEELRSR